MLPVCYLNISISVCETTKIKGISESWNTEPDADREEKYSLRAHTHT